VRLCSLNTENRNKILHEIAINKWFYDDGDNTLRLNYPSLSDDSIVFDVGSYLGDFSHKINMKYGCQCYLFEPHQKFEKKSRKLFFGNSKIKIFNYGLSNKDSISTLIDSNDASSFLIEKMPKKNTLECMLKDFMSVVRDLNIDKIDLLKINIEGGEYDLLSHIIKNKFHTRINSFQIQFHNFIPEAHKKRDSIIKELSKTHHRTWNYEFVWENWEKINPS